MNFQLLKVVFSGTLLLLSAVCLAQQDGLETVTDFDGNVYSTVRIGNQIWMAENFRCTHYSDGSPLENFTVNNDDSNTRIHGRLYRWQAAIGLTESESPSDIVQGASPDGWHIPNEEDWLELINYLGGDSIAGGKLKETGSNHWAPPNTGDIDTYGYCAIPSGWFDFSGEYLGFGEKTFFRSSTSPNNRGGFARELNHSSSTIGRVFLHPNDAISIRCIKNRE